MLPPPLRNIHSLLVLVFISFCVFTTAAPCQPDESSDCEQNDDANDACCGRDPRNDCGFYGIEQKECESRGCCWSPMGEHSPEPWCFHKNCKDPSRDTCSPYGRRVDCGYYGIDEDECEGKGCCWSPLEKDSFDPWCYFKNADDGECCDAESDRADCGYYGIKEKECESRGCCWSPLEKDSVKPWCFFKNSNSCKGKETTGGLIIEEAPSPEAPPSEPSSEPEASEASEDKSLTRKLKSTDPHSHVDDEVSSNKQKYKRRRHPKKGPSKPKSKQSKEEPEPEPEPEPKKPKSGPKVVETSLHASEKETKEDEQGTTTEETKASFEAKKSEFKEKGPGTKVKGKTETASEVIVKEAHTSYHGKISECIVFDKKQCGPDDIKKASCLKKGCCWHVDSFGFDPSCYYKDDFR